MRRFIILIFIFIISGLFTAALAEDKKSSIDWDSDEGVMVDVFLCEYYERPSAVLRGSITTGRYDDSVHFIYDDDLWWCGFSSPINSSRKVYHVPPFITHLPYSAMKKSPLSYYKKDKWVPEKNNLGDPSYETPVKKLDDLLKLKVMD